MENITLSVIYVCSMIVSCTLCSLVWAADMENPFFSYF